MPLNSVFALGILSAVTTYNPPRVPEVHSRGVSDSGLTPLECTSDGETRCVDLVRSGALARDARRDRQGHLHPRSQSRCKLAALPHASCLIVFVYVSHPGRVGASNERDSAGSLESLLYCLHRTPNSSRHHYFRPFAVPFEPVYDACAVGMWIRRCINAQE